MTELPLIVCDIQRAGPSTGMPTKTEQADLLQVMFGRNGEAPVPVLAAQSPVDCFDTAIEAVRIAIKYRTPVVILSDGYLANGAEPWRVPDLAAIPPDRPAVRRHPERGGHRRAAGLPALPARPRDAGPAVGHPGHGRPAAPDRRHREGQGHRRGLLRPGQPRGDGADPGGQGRRHRPRHPRPGRRRSTRPRPAPTGSTPGCWCWAGARRTGRSWRRSAGSARPAGRSPTPTCAT